MDDAPLGWGVGEVKSGEHERAKQDERSEGGRTISR